MNNSLLKKNKNIHQTDISCSDNQSIVFTDDDIEIDVEIDTCEKMVSNLNTNKKEVMLENVKNKINTYCIMYNYLYIYHVLANILHSQWLNT